MLEPLLQVHVPEILNPFLPVALNRAIQRFKDANDECPNPADPPIDGDVIDFTANSIVQQISSWIAETPIAKINEEVGKATEKSSRPCHRDNDGRVVLTEHPADPASNDHGDCRGVAVLFRESSGDTLNITTGGFRLEMSNLILEGLGTLDEDFAILKPVGRHSLNTTLGAGPLKASAHFKIQVWKGSQLRGWTNDEFDATIGSSTIKLILGLALQIQAAHLWDLRCGQTLLLQRPTW